VVEERREMISPETEFYIMLGYVVIQFMIIPLCWRDPHSEKYKDD